jgi:H+-transporting ATPase
VKANETPDKWNLPVLGVLSSVLGGVSCVSSLLILYFLLDSGNENGLFHKLGMPGVDYGQITLAIYLKVSVSDFLTLFSARTGSNFFWVVPPAGMLLGGGVFALILSSILSIFWPAGSIDGIEVEGLKSEMSVFVFVWLFCLVFFVIQDICKVIAFKIMIKYNFNGISDTGVVVLPESTKKLIAELESALEEQPDGHGH